MTNLLKQPILKDCKVILWKKCAEDELVCCEYVSIDHPDLPLVTETLTAEQCAAGESSVAGIEHKVVDDDECPTGETEQTRTGTYYVVQAEFRPLCVVTSIAIEETCPPELPPVQFPLVVYNRRAATSVYVDGYCGYLDPGDCDDPTGGGDSNCCLLDVGDTRECELDGAPNEYVNQMPAGALYTCNTELYYDIQGVPTLEEHMHAVGSFKLTAATDFDFDAYAEVTYPTYPLLHIDVCERTIYLESAWTQKVCSEERSGSSSEYSGAGTLGAVPVYGQGTHAGPGPCSIAGQLTGGLGTDITNGHESSSPCEVCGGEIDTSCECSGSGSGETSPGED